MSYFWMQNLKYGTHTSGTPSPHHTLSAFVCPVTSMRPIMVSIPILLIDHCDGPKSSALLCCVFALWWPSAVKSVLHDIRCIMLLLNSWQEYLLVKQYHFISWSSSTTKKKQADPSASIIFINISFTSIILCWKFTLSTSLSSLIYILLWCAADPPLVLLWGEQSFNCDWKTQ